MSDYIVHIPVANPLKFTYNGASTDHRANPDQRRFASAQHATIEARTFKQLFEQADPLRPQFYTNFPIVKVQLVTASGDVITVVEEYEPAIALQYRKKYYRSDCKFATYNGQLFIYFDEGSEYTDEDFLTEGDFVTLEGRLPNINAAVNNAIRYRIDGFDFESSNISEIIWNTDIQAEGYLLDVPASIIDGVSGVVEVRYDEKEGDLFSQLVDISDKDGIYFVRLLFGVAEPEGDDELPYIFTSEPLYIQETHETTLAIEYRHTGDFDKVDQWQYVYLEESWYNVMRVDSNHHAFVPSGDIENYTNDSNIPVKLRATPGRQMIFKAFDLPSWVIDKFNLVFAHDTKIINEYQWESEDFGNFTIINRTDIGGFEITLKQVDDRTLFKKTFTIAETASFDPETIEDITGAGAVVTADFVSNTDVIFHFVSLPPWIVCDHATFVDGDTLEFTIDPSAIDRNTILTAVNDELGVSATLTIAQLSDGSSGLTSVDPEELIVPPTASVNEVEVTAAAGTRWQLSESVSWLSVTLGIQEGTQTVEIIVQAKTTLGSRTANVAVINVDDISDFLIIEVTQEGTE